MVEIQSEFERMRGVKSLGQGRSAWGIFRQKAVWVTSESGDGRAEKPRYDVPHGVGVKNRYEQIRVADRGQQSGCILLYRAVARNGCGIPLSIVHAIKILKYTPAVRSKISSKYIFASCVILPPIARITWCVSSLRTLLLFAH